MRRIHVIVRGRVQGVGFRYFIDQLAHQYGLVGWVTNLGDGSVEIEVQGESLTIEAFLAAVKIGNGYSQARELVLDEMDTVPREKGFIIL